MKNVLDKKFFLKYNIPGCNSSWQTACLSCRCYQNVSRKYVSLFRDVDGKIFNLNFLLNRETQNKGVAIDNIHYLNDGLWLMRNIK